MKIFSFSKESKNEKDLSVVEETKREEMPIMDMKVIEFIVNNFQEPTQEIVDSLSNLQSTLERSIDFIEDKSSELIKSERNFKVSGEYRENSIRLHDISMSIKEYIKWMNELTEKPDPHINENKNLPSDSKKDILKLESTPQIKQDSIIQNNLEKKDNLSRSIYEDFTGKTPKGFCLDKTDISVDGWEDLSVKTADLLIKKYKKNKGNNNIKISALKPVNKKSPQNDFRDTIIEMLIEYKIDPKKYNICF